MQANFFGRNNPQWARASSFTKFLDHTQRRTRVGRSSLDEWSARRKDLYLTTHNTQKRQIAIPPVGFEPTISADERLQTYVLDRAATGTGKCRLMGQQKKGSVSTIYWLALQLFRYDWWLFSPVASDYTGFPRRNVPDFGRVFLMLNYTDINQNTYIQSWTVTEIMAREVWNFDSCYSLIVYQIHIETGRNMWFL